MVKIPYLYILIHDMKAIISERRNLGVGLAMFSMNAILKGIFLQHSSRGGGGATEHGLGEALALWQTLLLDHTHLEAHGVPRPCTSLLATLDQALLRKIKWTKITNNFWSFRSGKRCVVVGLTFWMTEKRFS